ncbi:DNA-binding transcriptional MerR regulator [Microbacteriaceae bacterium SG_E_30_P1]|uniref:DNA-binding transcriptional MerR regulator n=1 Tax=Antiquaquibacter oligotrophicus TaxID=2880260 RepID=A0ABT6KT16_9MICO|nr:MerR family transcriptional regulator [Antiquaquibacter oligotrophicus]MDH6182319.1 DNA-binding transcriptional MerR regulator [Antiquaquibacter oligotrophicus]UDF12027.1 MerR family transcriptional regulator [Antiquaquibacter oligotrophicus]
MHSGELARLAGVSVRALRHYHHVGVLAEPERRSNGYRDYDVHDLIRVLRIKRLAALGISLERMPELLDNPDTAHDLLDELDAELAAQIDRLTAQRNLIARLRAMDAAPDLPPELAPYLAAFGASGVSPELIRMDREQSVLLAHLAGEEGMPHLARFYERVSDPELVPAVVDVAERFERLGPESRQEDVDDFIETFMATFSTVIDEFADVEAAMNLSSVSLVTDYATGMLNEQQRGALDELDRRMSSAREE